MTTRRRPRGAAVGSPALYARVDPEAAEIADTVAKRLGVSKAEFLTEVLLHAGTTLDSQGVPTWWTKPVPDAEELDLHAS